MNLKKECLGRGNTFTLKPNFCLCLLDKQKSNQARRVFYPEAFTLLKRQMSDWCDCGPDVRVAHIQRQRLRMQLHAAACRGIPTGSEYEVEWSGYCGPWLLAWNSTCAQECHTEGYSNDGLGCGFWWQVNLSWTFSSLIPSLSRLGFRLQTSARITSYPTVTRVPQSAKRRWKWLPKLFMKTPAAVKYSRPAFESLWLLVTLWGQGSKLY